MTTLRVGAAPEVFIALAEIFDGQSAVAHRDMVRIEEGVAPALVWSGGEAGKVRLPLDSLRELPDQADAGTMVLTSTERPLIRIILRNMEDVAPLRGRLPLLNATQPVRGKGRVFAWAVGAVASVALIIFALVPLMADQLARVLPAEGEQALGDATYEQIQTALGEDMLDQVPECSSSRGDLALLRMVDRLDPESLGLPYDLRVTVLDHPMQNAFALPGGRIVFFRGLIELAETPDEIAAVLAHEIGHVAAHDPTRIALRSAGSIGVLGLLLGDFAGGAVVLFLVDQLIQADYTRTAEADADSFAYDMLAKAKVDASALGTLFERLLAQNGDDNGIASHFMSHPALGDRIAAAEAAALPQGETRPALDDRAWADLQAICD